MTWYLRALLAVFVLSACDDGPKKVTAIEKSGPPPIQSTTIPEAIRLPEAPTHRLNLAPAKRLNACHTFFERDGAVVKSFPFPEGDRYESLLSCDADAWTLGSDGAIYVAYSIPSKDSSAKDFRFVAFEPDGAYRWSINVDRSTQVSNFVANYRQGYVTELGDRHICAGTLWEGGTQGTCADPKTGEINWNGRMSFWAGFPPQSIGDNTMYVADLSSLTRRYPFSGVEMRQRDLDGSGGRSATYLTDGNSLFFSPSRTEEHRFVRYDFKTLDAKWRIALPESPSPGFGDAFAEHGVFYAKIGKRLVVFSSDTGKALWSIDTDEDRPSVAATKDALIVLHRVPDVPNPVVAFDPKTGKMLWHATAPAGIISVFSDTKHIYLRGVRATERVTGVDAL